MRAKVADFIYDVVVITFGILLYDYVHAALQKVGWL